MHPAGVRVQHGPRQLHFYLMTFTEVVDVDPPVPSITTRPPEIPAFPHDVGHSTAHAHLTFLLATVCALRYLYMPLAVMLGLLASVMVI